MKVKFAYSVQTVDGKSFERDAVVEKSAVPGQLLAGWIVRGIAVEIAEDGMPTIHDGQLVEN